jgi:hypothetical protein
MKSGAARSVTRRRDGLPTVSEDGNGTIRRDAYDDEEALN